MADVSVGWWVHLRHTRFLQRCIPLLLHPHLSSHQSSLNSGVKHRGLGEPVRVIEVGVEQRRNATAEETGDPRENPPTIPTCENPGAIPPVIELKPGWWDVSSLTTEPPRPL
ncbi:hypothetical protein PR048_027709 [Dryococelus australis]|uniref:Uncharacterized protein n=1 Tax=Dryococelus australis TaxID=614101 RepID=A0ABQ9GH98_9NEOP|nr:hypothetical protein PR048_027709 [Dryococelus australis]